MKKEEKAHSDAKAELSRREADLATATAKFAGTDPDDASKWTAAEADVRRLTAARDRASRELDQAAAAVAQAQREAIEAELRLVEARLAPQVLEGKLTAVRQRAAAAVREMFAATIDIARAIDAQHADVTECARLCAQLGIAHDHRPADRDLILREIAVGLQEEHARLRRPRDLACQASGLPNNLVTPGLLFPRAALPPVEGT